MSKFEYLKIEKCNIEIFEKIYNIYNTYNEDRTRENYLNEIIIEKFYTDIILIYDNNIIIGYTLLKINNMKDSITIIVGDSVLNEGYIGKSIIGESLFNVIKKNFNKNKKMYTFWLCNTVYTYLYCNKFKKSYPNKNNVYIPNEYKNIYINCLKLFTNNIYDSNEELNLIVKYQNNFGKVRKKFAKIRDNFKIDENVNFFLEINKNYLDGDCLCLICEIDIDDINRITNNYKKKKNRINILINHFLSIFA